MNVTDRRLFNLLRTKVQNRASRENFATLSPSPKDATDLLSERESITQVALENLIKLLSNIVKIDFRSRTIVNSRRTILLSLFGEARIKRFTLQLVDWGGNECADKNVTNVNRLVST
jgi:hypothetical protein